MMVMGSGGSPMVAVVNQKNLPKNKTQEKNAFTSVYNSTRFKSTKFFVTTDTIRQTNPREINNGVAYPTKITHPDNSGLVTVGATCSVVGFFTGIIITLLFWIMRKRIAKNSRRNALVMKKNPKERTFETININKSRMITRPEHTYLDGNTRPNCLGINSTNMTCMHDSEHIITGCKIPYETQLQFNYQTDTNHCALGYKTCTNPTNYECSCRHCNKSVCSEKRLLKQSNHNFKVYSIEDHTPTSFSRHESLSSGLGTGTESDILSFEAKFPAIDSSLTEIDSTNYVQDGRDFKMYKLMTLQNHIRPSKSVQQINSMNKTLQCNSNKESISGSNTKSTTKSSTLPCIRKSNKTQNLDKHSYCKTRSVKRESETKKKYPRVTGQKVDLCKKQQFMEKSPIKEAEEDVINLSMTTSAGYGSVTESSRSQMKIIRCSSDIVIDL